VILISGEPQENNRTSVVSKKIAFDLNKGILNSLYLNINNGGDWFAKFPRKNNELWIKHFQATLVK